LGIKTILGLSADEDETFDPSKEENNHWVTKSNYISCLQMCRWPEV